MTNEIYAIEKAIKEQLSQSEMWEEHYHGDPQGDLDEAFWKGKARGQREILHYVQSLLPITEGDNPITKPEAQCSATRKTVGRINFLKDPSTLDTFMDALQSDGMPMGSERWAEYCHMRFMELKEKEKTLSKILASVHFIGDTANYCGGKFYRDRLHRITEEFQAEERRKERESMEE